MLNEIWKDIEGFDGLYQISNLGNIKSYHSYRRRFKGGINDKQIHLNIHGYLTTMLSKNNVNKLVKIHRLVASAFIPNPDNKPQVNHIDCVKTNNQVWNLEWVTNRENRDHAIANNLTNTYAIRKIPRSEFDKIRSMYHSGITQVSIAKIYGVTSAAISLTLKGIEKRRKEQREFNLV